mmetsp:Transcript_14586/g.21897  ORF Transcript_14586/g.21897 Transcript_14586/m.21897 type:complete len:90 (-) Transcript_14586:1069-1338(-)
MKNFQIDQSQEESPHSFETAAGDIFYGIIALCVVDQSQLDDTTVKCSSGEASFSLSRNDLITHTHPKKSLHTFTIDSLFQQSLHLVVKS